jgi:WD40 repeat protein
MRVFVHSKRNATKNRALALDPMATTWPEFVRQLSDKFGFCVTEVCLDVDGQQVEIDDIGALHDGDWIVIDGISLDPLPAAASTAAVVTSNAANNAGNKKRSSRRAAAAAAAAAAATSSALDDASSSATTSADRADLSGVAPALLGLTNTLARLCHKLERYTDRLDEAQQRSVTQHEQLLKVLPTTRTSHHARPPRMSGATAPKKSVPPIDPSYERLRTIAMFEDHTAPVWCLTVSGTTLISGSEDATIRLWSLETMKAIGVLTGHDSTVHCLCTFSKRWLISGSDDKSVRVWDLNKLKCVNVAPDSHTQPIISIAVNSSSLFTGSLHEIQVFDMQGQAFRESGWKPVRTLTGHKGHWVHGLLLYQKFLISSSNNLIKVWNAESLEELRTCKTVQGGSIYALAVIEEDGKPVRLVTGTWESTIQIFDFLTLECIKTVPAHQASVLSLVVNGRYLFSGSYDTYVKVWDATTTSMLRPIDTLFHHGGKVEALVAAGDYICSAGTDSRIRVWGVPKKDDLLQQPFAQLAGPGGAAPGAALMPGAGAPQAAASSMAPDMTPRQQ